MKQKSILLGLVMGLTLASQDTQSLGMGTIQVHSALDQPLQASIDLMMGENEDFSNLSVKLASAADYKKVGLDRSFVPSNISVAVDEDNPLLIRVSSAGPISEPIVTLLLDVNWGNGRIFREFTILLDPPVYNSSQIITDSAVTEVATYQEPEPEEIVAEVVDETPQVQTRAEAAVEDNEPVVSEIVEEDNTAAVETIDSYEPSVNSVEVMSGDTLWSLANQNKPSSLTTNQMMAALFNTNPQAFSNNNINQLIKGSRLMIPTASELQSISQADALDLVQSHNDSWTPSQASEDSYSSFQTSEPVYEAPAEEVAETIDYGVELSGSTDQEDSNGGQEGDNYENLNDNAVAEELYNKDSENEELKERLSELEGIVEQQQEALEIKSDDLANLEDQLTDTPENAEATDETVLTESDDVWGDDPSVALTEEELAADGDAESMITGVDVSESPVEAAEQESSVEEKPEPVKSATPSFSGPQSSEESMVDKVVNWVMENLQWLLIGLVALLALIFVPKFFRSRNKDVTEETSFLDDIKTRNNDDESTEDALVSSDDTKVNEPLQEEELTEEPVVDGDVLADLDKKIDFESEANGEEDDEDIFQGFDDEPEVLSDSKEDLSESNDDFDLDGFLSDDEVESSDELEKTTEEDSQSEPETEEESFDVDEDFDFDLSELDDLDDASKEASDGDLSGEIDDALESLADDAEDAVEEVVEIAEEVEPDFSLDEDFEFDLDGELDDLAEDADEAVEDLVDEADDAFDEVMDISDDVADTLEVSTEADDSEIDLGLDLDDMLEDGDVIDTKLDLAKAYLEMGDKDGAKNLLKEVAAEGNDSQVETAKKLLDDM